MRILLSILLILTFVPTWSGEPRLPLWDGASGITVRRVVLDPRDPAGDRVGSLQLLAGWHLASANPGFGGYSAMAVTGRRFTLLSDGGLILRMRVDGARGPRDFAQGALPGGPGTGWAKLERDSESLAQDPATGRYWVGFERANQIWRYAPGFSRAEARTAPPAMRSWPSNSGAETLLRLSSGRFLALAEGGRAGRDGRPALVFAGDPTRGARSFAFAYVPPAGYRATDAAELPGGRLVVLNRRFALHDGFTAKLAVLDLKAIRPGARVVGREIATLAAPLIHDNFEGLAITREGRATILWLVSDDNQSWFQRTLLLKFRLMEGRANDDGPPSGGDGGPSANR